MVGRLFYTLPSINRGEGIKESTDHDIRQLSLHKTSLGLIYKRNFSTAPIIDRQLSRQKIRQKFSVIITKTCVFARTVFSSFCCLQDKKWIKMPKWTIFVMSSDVFVLITENFWRIFWRDNWPSIIGAVEN